MQQKHHARDKNTKRLLLKIYILLTFPDLLAPITLIRVSATEDAMKQEESSGKPHDVGSAIVSTAPCGSVDQMLAAGPIITSSSSSPLPTAVVFSAAIGIALALGSYVGVQWSSETHATNKAQAKWATVTTSRIDSNQKDIISLAEDIRLVKDTITSLSEGLAQDRARAASQEELLRTSFGALSRSAEALLAKLDEQNGMRVSRAEAAFSREDTAPKLPPIEPLPPTASSNGDMSGTGLSVATESAVLPPPRPSPRSLAPIAGWVLRDVYNGRALIENSRKVLHEVGPGKMLPGVGRIEAIKREGKTWVVVTNEGLITHDGTP